MKFPALAVLLMVNVLPVISVAELSRPTLAAPLMLSELPDTAPVDDSVELVAAHVALRGEPVQRGRASESASRSVTETDSPSKALALICMLYRSSVPADCCPARACRGRCR